MELKAFTASRPTTNLVPSPKYQLTKDQMKSGFMGVFNWQYSGDPRKTLFKVALGAIMDTTTITLGKPPRAVTQEERAARKAKAQSLRMFEERRVNAYLSQYTSLKKVNGDDAHFVLSLPVLSFQDVSQLETVCRLFGSASPENDAVAALANILSNSGTHKFDARLCLERSRLSPETKRIIGQSFLGVVAKSFGNNCVFFLQFKIAEIEAEALVSTDWLEIRPVDLYPLFVMWVEAEYESKLYGKSAISLSKIAKTLPPHAPEDRRTDQHGLSIGMDGQPVFMPQECDNADKYEALYASSGVREDGEFSLMDVGVPDSFPNLPANIPILVDWVNFKFTYSNTAGRPVVVPLENMRKCTPAMALNILNRPIPDKFLERLGNYGVACNIGDMVSMHGMPLTAEENAQLVKLFRNRSTITIREYAAAIRQQDPDKVIRYRDLVEDNEAVFKPAREYIMKLHPAMEHNLEAMYQKYAVSTIMDAMGILGVLVYYGVPMGDTEAEANRANKAALEQGIDPNWTPPPMPLITSRFSAEDGGLLPHQAKVRNLLRESPDFAILAVDAGGGKSMLSITDILYEIKEQRSAPYLIMCPSHLVANYVSELVEFTDGKVNVIPVTSYNIKTSGYERYQNILETAPLNTVLVVDYTVLKFRARSAVYGTASVFIYPVVEMIRKFRPGYVMLDESHFLKNAKSATFKSVMNLIADIPKKRLASGTLNPDSPSDLPAQVAIMDPTIFGTREDFNNTYGELISGARVLKWRQTGPNSVGGVMAKLKRSVVWCPAKRKEWACALPPRQDRFLSVELTERQRDVYNAIFADMIQQIRKAAETDKNAKKLLDSLEGRKASADDESDFGDLGDADAGEDMLDDEADIGPGLQPYLVDIERFVTNPGFHPYARNGYVMEDGTRVAPLTGDDLMPPKAKVLKHLLLEDYKVMDPSSGKALVFVNYSESASSIFESMPPELQACGILYSTSNKTELVNKFKNDPKVRWMIGIRKSLEVGLNLQVASALVRLEGVWTPGEQEQGDSRIARPYFGPGGDKRPVLKFDTIVANRTIDITKAARLRAKMVALAKFENSSNPAYDALDDIPIIPMKLDAIQSMNDFDTNLARYETTMRDLNNITKQEYAEYRAKIEAEGGFKFTQVAVAPVPPGCALLARVPYAQGTELYKASELGLVRVDNYLGMDLTGQEDEGDEEPDTEDGSDAASAIRERIVGLPCHTEYGDGIIVGAMAPGGIVTRLHVKLNDGTTARGLKSTNVFVITRTETNSIDLRNKLIQAAGLSTTAEITVPGLNVQQTRVTLKEQREAERRKEAEIRERQRQAKKDSKKKRLSISLQLNIINGFLQVGYVPSGDADVAAKALEALGFKQNPAYYYTRIKSYRQLITQATNWANADFHVGDKYDSGALAALSVALTQNGLQSHRHYSNLMGAAQFRNYMRETFKPTADKKLLNIFALVTDGGIFDPLNAKRAAAKSAETGEEVNPAYGISYLCLPAGGGHPGSRLAIASKYSAPGTRWRIADPMLTRFVGSLAGVHKILAELKDAGIVVNNVDKLNQYAKSVRKVVPKTDGDILSIGNDEEPEVVETPPKTRRTRSVEPTPVRKTRKAEPVKVRKVR